MVKKSQVAQVTFFLPSLRLNRTIDAEYGDDAEYDDGVAEAVEEVQDICAYSRHQGLGHKISGMVYVCILNLDQ